MVMLVVVVVVIFVINGNNGGDGGDDGDAIGNDSADTSAETTTVSAQVK